MKTKKKKTFDAVEMVREIRHAMYHKEADTDFDDRDLERIKRKWAKRLKDQERENPKKAAHDK